MIRKAARRLGSSLLVLWLVLTAAFVVHHAIPSDPARAMAGPQARPADVDRIRQKMGLDRPLWVQYWLYVRRIVHGGPSAIPPKDPQHRSCAAIWRVHFDLGMSFQRRKPVLTLLAERLPRSALLALASVFVQVVAGVVVGTVAALNKGRWADRGIIGITLVGISTPTFVTGLVLQYWLAFRWKLLPLDGWGQTTGDHAACLVLPALTLGVFGASFYARFVRDELLGQLEQDYMRTAAAKGLPRWRAVLVHALRNAMMPLITVIGMDLGALIGGAIVTEKLFQWPGLGSLSVDAVIDRDVPVVMGVVIVASLAVILCNLVVDAAYGLLDPRVRAEKADHAA